MNRIKELRNKKGVTQTDIANLLGIGKSSISRFENGKRNPKPDNWNKMADYFNVSVAYLKGFKVWTKEEIAEIAYELFPLGDTIGDILNRSWNTVPMKWLLEKPELNASEEDVRRIIRMYCH